MNLLAPNLINIVDKLNDGQFHDGDSLGEALHITRSAVWKLIKKLQKYGINIVSVKGKGYALLEPLILLNKKIIEENIHLKSSNIILLEYVQSTNDYLKNIKNNSNKVTICLAEQQTKGRGRLARTWHSPFAQNIYFSCAYRLEKDVSELAGLSLIVSLAIIKTLTQYQSATSFLVKWPNDILFDNKKISGNLVDIQAESNGICNIIIGIGLNVNMLDMENKIDQPWISLRKIIGNYIDRNQLCVMLINNLLDYLHIFSQTNLLAFMDEWNQVDFLKSKETTIINNEKKIEGKAMGINHSGNLMLKTKNGDIMHFSSGDTSIARSLKRARESLTSKD